MNYNEIIKKIKDHSAIVGVVGLGYVGLPLLLSLGKEGFKMTGIDIDNNKISDLKNNSKFSSIYIINE